MAMRAAAVTMALLALLVSVGCGDGESGGSGDQVTVRVGSQEVRADESRSLIIANGSDAFVSFGERGLLGQWSAR